MSTSTRRTTRRNAASADSAQAALERSAPQDSPPPEPSRTRTRRPRAAAAAPAEAQRVTKSKTVTKVTATSNETTAVNITTARPSPVSKRITRAERARLAAGEASPQRSLEHTQTRRGPTRQHTASKTPEPEQRPEQVHDDNNDEQGLFFSQSEHNISSDPMNTRLAALKSENDGLRHAVQQLEARITELEAANVRLSNLQQDYPKALEIRVPLVDEIDELSLELGSIQPFRESPSPPSPPSPPTSPMCWSPEPGASSEAPTQTLSEQFSQLWTGQVSANRHVTEFDDHVMRDAETSPVQPTFVNGSKSAIALLHKIEAAAKESTRIEPSVHDNGETLSDEASTLHLSPSHSRKRSFTEASATPERPSATPSSFFSRSFSAIKSRLGFSSGTPKPPPSSEAPTPFSVQPRPPPGSWTELFSIPPTPIGERTHRTPPRRRRMSNSLMRTLLRGVEHEDKRKAEAWANEVIPKLKNDPKFREKRKRLEQPTVFADLKHFPTSKPWETGFGDPLWDLNDHDVVPPWAVYLGIVAEEEEHRAKRHKTAHGPTTGDDLMLNIDEQFAASSSANTSPSLHNSQGQSASMYDLEPRRSINPSPMFATPVSHHDGGNLFSELQKDKTAAEIRANEREVLKHKAKDAVQTHNPTMGSFSVPEDSDEDSTMVSETPDGEATPLWTQPPPPAPVPAHAPLPGGPASDAPSVHTVQADAPSASGAQQPVDEVERQRQRLMKHTPAKPSRLREATYPSPSLLSDAGNESLLAATPAQMAAMFAGMPSPELVELDDECQATLGAIVGSDQYKQQLGVNAWPAAIVTYESDEENLSPV